MGFFQRAIPVFFWYTNQDKDLCNPSNQVQMRALNAHINLFNTICNINLQNFLPTFLCLNLPSFVPCNMRFGMHDLNLASLAYEIWYASHAYEIWYAPSQPGISRTPVPRTCRNYIYV